MLQSDMTSSLILRPLAGMCLLLTLFVVSCGPNDPSAENAGTSSTERSPSEAADLPANAADRPAPDCSELDSTSIAAGEAIFTGKGLCFTCHGRSGEGMPIGPSLVDKEWIHIDGELQGIVKVVRYGIPHPKEHPSTMPPMGGGQLSDEEICNVSAFVYSIAHNQK
jgi:mono/diheme cytochrome c family protein